MMLIIGVFIGTLVAFFILGLVIVTAEDEERKKKDADDLIKEYQRMDDDLI